LSRLTRPGVNPTSAPTRTVICEPSHTVTGVLRLQRASSGPPTAG